jgi:peptide/nickel transport system substrate-binding protein
LALTLVFALAAAACAAPVKGGLLRFAMIDEPPSLDQQLVTSDLGTMIAQHIFEGLYCFNAKYEPVPLLVKTEDIQDGGKTVVLTLREGVKFHNGKILDAGDVIASLTRWSKFGTRGPVLFSNIDKMEQIGQDQIKLTFKQPFAPWKNLLAFTNGGPVVYPKAVAEKADKGFIPPEEYIGTGPYKFAEHNPGRYISLKRFDEYVFRTEPEDGYAGKREALFDELRFIPVPDPGTRVNGVKAGDYDFAEQLPGDLYESLKADSSVRTTLSQGATQVFLFANSSAGVLKDNYKLRQALLAALNIEAGQAAAFGPRGLWILSGSLMPDTTPWYSEAGIKNYNVHDVALAKKLAQEAGYKGEKIRYMTTTSYQYNYDYSTVMAQNLRDAGFNIDLQVYDWATLVSKRADPEQWDLFLTAHGFIPEPALFTFISEAYPGWWKTEQKRSLTKEFSETIDPVKRKEIWEKIQTLVYEEIPVMKSGFHYVYYLYSPKIEGVGDSALIWPKFWGIGFGK